jgi:hypothetical protein
MSEMKKAKTVRRKRCQGGQPTCKNLVDIGYKDVDSAGCCAECDKYIDENPYDPYWEHMDNDFEFSEEHKYLEDNNLLDDYDAYEKAFEEYQEKYESWPDMRRRMAKEREKERTKEREKEREKGPEARANGPEARANGPEARTKAKEQD